MDHVDIINYLIERNNYQSYLEIGLGEGVNFLQVNCRYKESVDPYENFLDALRNTRETNEWIIAHVLTHRMTSDEFFMGPGANRKFDIIFIDGLHYEEQVDKDILNSLQHLNEGGKIVVHDCLPYAERFQLEERPEGAWNGTTWKSIPKLTLMGLDYYTVDTDFGCCVINYKSNPELLQLPPKSDYDYNTVFSSQLTRDIMLRVINEETFYRIY